MVRLFFLGISLLLPFWNYALSQNNPPICLPLGQLHINSPYGKRIHPVTGKPDFHQGVDLAAHCAPVFSIMDGKVSGTGYNPILGNYVRVMHGQFQSVYGHLSSIIVFSGEEVSAGQPIGITGATGRVTGEHLHFSIKFGNRYLNPLLFLKTMLTAKSSDQY